MKLSTLLSTPILKKYQPIRLVLKPRVNKIHKRASCTVYSFLNINHSNINIMNSRYFPKTICFVLVYFSLHFTASLLGQGKTVQFPTHQNASVSQKTGILGKMTSLSQLHENDILNQNFYSDILLDKKHGLTPHVSERNNSEYGYLEHLGTGMNIPYASVTDSAGNTYITGAGSNTESAQGDFLTIKVGVSGEIIWEKREAGTLYAVEYGVNIALDETGNPIATGVQWNGNDMDVFTIKYDQNTGNELWSSVYDGGHGALDAPTTMAIDDSGAILIGGISYTGTSVEYLLLKYDASGQPLWSAVDSNPILQSWNEPTAIATDAFGNIAITGYAAVDGDSQGYWEGYLTIFYDSNGNQVWRQPYLFERNVDENDPTSEIIKTHSVAKGIAFDASGNIIVTGTFDVASADRTGTIKYNTNGDESWIKTYRAGEFNNDITNGHDVKIGGADKIYIVGRHRSGWINEGLLLISYEDDGSENWVEENQNIIQIQTAKMVLDINNLPVIAGLGYDENTEDQRVRVFRYSEEGEILKETSYLKLDSNTEGIRDLINLAIDDNDNAYAVLDNYYTSRGGVFETVKMPFDSGPNNPEWTAIYETPFSSSNTRMLSSTFDSDSNTYVTGDFGVIENNQYFRNFFVAKYNMNGEVEWEKDFNQQNGNEAEGIVAKIDSEENLIVFLLPNPESALPLRIKKYNTAGNLIWETEKELHTALLRAFFLDDNNNIYVGGYSKENIADDFPVFTTIKYTSEGNEAWTRFATTGNPDDFIFEINAGAVNAEGDVVLTGVSGYSTMFANVVDLTVLKYNSSGDLEWLNKYPQPDFVSTGFDLLIANNNVIYVSGMQQQEITSFVEELVALKIDNDGEEVWTTSYGQSNEGRRIRPYKIMQNTEGNLVIPSYSLYWVMGETPNNRINTLQLNKESGEIEWENNSEIGRYYRDAYIDGEDNLFILNQAGEFTYKRLGSYTLGTLLKIDNNGDAIEESFYEGPELPDFDPTTISPLNNGTLLMGGTLYNNSFFSGLYFFEANHIPLGITENDNQLPTNSNWLGQNYPNPVNSRTSIPLYLLNGGSTDIAIYDSLGRMVYSLTKTFDTGQNIIEMDLSHLKSGIYYYQIQNGPFKAARKLIKQ